jgi:hypothetical protein
MGRKNMGILKKYEYRSTWMRYADLPAETGAIADGNTPTEHLPARAGSQYRLKAENNIVR